MEREPFFNYLEHPDQLDEQTLPVLKQLVEVYPVFQSAWILLLKNLKKLDDPAFDSYLEQAAIRIADRRKLYFFLNETGNENDLTGESKMDDPLAIEYMTPGLYQLKTKPEEKEETLIDLVKSIRKKQAEKALNDAEQIPQPKPEENAESSFVTETLAKIYSQQGHYQKAIAAYENLSLKYPEKSTYFAGQIEKIKELIK